MNLLTIDNNNLVGFDIYYFFKYYQKEIKCVFDKEEKGLLFIYDQFFPFQVLESLAKNNKLSVLDYINERINILYEKSYKKLEITEKIYFFYTFTFYSKYDYDFNILEILKLKIENKFKKEVTFILNNHFSDDNYLHFNSYRYDVYNNARLIKKIKNHNIKDKIFICLNAKQRLHRDHLYEYITKNNLINNFYYSYFHKNIYLRDINDYTIFAKKYVKNEEKSGHLAFEYYLNDDLFNTKNGLLFDKSYYYIITETSNSDNLCFMGEKTYKAFYHKIPFIILGNPYSLKNLKKEGFKTFDKWIDESYDEELNYEKRKNKIFKEIQRLNFLSISEHERNIQEMNKILEYNYNHFFDIKNFKNDFLKFF